MSNYLWLVIAAGALGVLYGLVQTASLMKASTGNDKMREIAAAIQEGASAYLRRQYTTIAMVGVVILVAAYFLIGEWAAIGFVIGAVLSGLAGFAGMLISVRANVRTAQAASESLGKGLDLAFRSGAITGMFVAGGALLGVAGYYAILTAGLGFAGIVAGIADKNAEGLQASRSRHKRRPERLDGQSERENGFEVMRFRKVNASLLKTGFQILLRRLLAVKAHHVMQRQLPPPREVHEN